jgi:hypothetical protein
MTLIDIQCSSDIAKGVADMQAGKVGPVDMADIRAEGRRF